MHHLHKFVRSHVLRSLSLLFVWGLSCLFVLGVFAQGADPNAPAPAPNGVLKGLDSLSTEAFLQGLMDPYDYNPRARRDPFDTPVPDKPMDKGLPYGPAIGLQQFDLGMLKLVGVLWDVKKPRAMLVDPAGKIHVVGPNAKVGQRNGYVAVIREGEIVVVETTEDEATGHLTTTAQVMKLAK